METALDTPAETLPAQPRSSGFYSVVYDSEEGIKIEERPFKKDIIDFINTIQQNRILVVYRVSEVISLKTKVTF